MHRLFSVEDPAVSKSDKAVPASKAGGLPSIQSTIVHLVKSQKSKDNLKNLLKVNQISGFDCPGCAWGDRKEGLFQFCENGAKAIAWESTEKTIGEAFFAEHTVSKLNKQSDYWLEYQGRLSEPLSYNKTEDKYQPISWQDAFELIAAELQQLDSADELELYTSGRASNEAAYLYQLFGRAFGTNNFPDCSNMCHEASGVALKKSIGIGKGTVVLDDFDHADVMFVFGQNPGTNHPRMLNALRSAAKRGGKIVAVNNLKEVALKRFASPQSPIEVLTPMATDISSLYLSPKLGGDMALIRGMVKHILEEHPHSLNKDFIQQHTQGFEQYLQKVNDTRWQSIEQQSGMPKQQIEQAAEIFLSGKKVISCWAMGITQHKHSVATIRELTNLHLMTGQIGRQGAGLCPVRGHSNVQGNRTVGINEQPPEALLDALENQFKFDVPRQQGHNVHYALKALHEKSAKVLICLGGNLAAASPDSEFTHQAMSNARLNVQISTKLNRSHLMVSDRALILPCLGRTEVDLQHNKPQKITVEDTFSMVHASSGSTQPVSDKLMSETAIIANIAQATLGNQPVNWLELASDYDRIRDLIATTLPQFADFNQRINHPGGFHLTNSAHQLIWNTESHKANFSAESLPESLINTVLLQNQSNSKTIKLFTLQTLRSHDQFNTTIYDMNDRYRGIKGERRVVFIHPKDAKK
jgi:molybdopterin-dependent oxidoreductase alpha subunit